MTKILLAITLVFITGLAYISVVQNATIISQRTLLRAMETNPACMVSPAQARRDLMTLRDRQKQAQQNQTHVTEN